jgi:hypothetical protein
MAKMQNWGIVSALPEPFAAFGPTLLIGNVYGHEKLADGEQITTSPIVEVKDGKIVTKNTVYELDGPANPDFAKFVLEEIANNPAGIEDDALQALVRGKVTVENVEYKN